MAEIKKDVTRVITGKVRFSYLHVFEPDAIDESSEKKYSASIIIPKSDKATIAAINAAIAAAKEQGKTSKWGGKIPAKLDTPLRDGDIDREDDEAYAGAFFVNAKSKSQPGIIDLMKKQITSEEEFYSGCYGRASLTFYPYDASGNRGIAVALNNLQKTSDGEPLSGKVAADVEFAEDPDFLEDDYLD